MKFLLILSLAVAAASASGNTFTVDAVSVDNDAGTVVDDGGVVTGSATAAAGNGNKKARQQQQQVYQPYPFLPYAMLYRSGDLAPQPQVVVPHPAAVTTNVALAPAAAHLPVAQRFGSAGVSGELNLPGIFGTSAGVQLGGHNIYGEPTLFNAGIETNFLSPTPVVPGHDHYGAPYAFTSPYYNQYYPTYYPTTYARNAVPRRPVVPYQQYRLVAVPVQQQLQQLQQQRSVVRAHPVYPGFYY